MLWAGYPPLFGTVLNSRRGAEAQREGEEYEIN
jgi:hypothetical protein